MEVRSASFRCRAEASGSCACRTAGVLELNLVGVGEGVQEIRPPVRYQRPGWPEQDVRTDGFTGSTVPSGPRGPVSLLFGYSDVRGGFEGNRSVGRPRREQQGPDKHTKYRPHRPLRPRCALQRFLPGAIPSRSSPPATVSSATARRSSPSRTGANHMGARLRRFGPGYADLPAMVTSCSASVVQLRCSTLLRRTMREYSLRSLSERFR